MWRHKYGILYANVIYILFDVEWPADDLHRADLITELLSVRDGVQSVEMTQADMQDVFAIVRTHALYTRFVFLVYCTIYI